MSERTAIVNSIFHGKNLQLDGYNIGWAKLNNRKHLRAIYK
jgi:hypothetical protein